VESNAQPEQKQAGPETIGFIIAPMAAALDAAAFSRVNASEAVPATWEERARKVWEYYVEEPLVKNCVNSWLPVSGATGCRVYRASINGARTDYLCLRELGSDAIFYIDRRRGRNYFRLILPKRLGNSVKQIINIHQFLLCSGFSAPYIPEKRRTCRMRSALFIALWKNALAQAIADVIICDD
jgi:hypothetical protein